MQTELVIVSLKEEDNNKLRAFYLKLPYTLLKCKMCVGGGFITKCPELAPKPACSWW